MVNLIPLRRSAFVAMALSSAAFLPAGTAHAQLFRFEPPRVNVPHLPRPGVGIPSPVPVDGERLGNTAPGIVTAGTQTSTPVYLPPPGGNGPVVVPGAGGYVPPAQTGTVLVDTQPSGYGLTGRRPGDSTAPSYRPPVPTYRYPNRAPNTFTPPTRQARPYTNVPQNRNYRR